MTRSCTIRKVGSAALTWLIVANGGLSLTIASAVYEDAKLLASDGTAGDWFGGFISISGDTAVVGANRRNDDVGTAYVFVRDGTSWSEQAKLLASDGAAGDNFGRVALYGDTVLIGATRDDDNGEDSGSVYVFVRNGTSWTQQAKLLPSDGAADDEFGTVSLFGDTALIGAHYDDDSGEESGSAYVFVRDGASWTQQSKLLPSDGAAHDFFGGSVSLFGDTAVISASHDDVYGPDSGAAYVFVRDGSNWTQQAKLLPSDGGATDYFGWGLAVFGDTALIGARWDDDNGLDSGSAYVFVRDDMTWTQQAKLLPSDGAAGDHFGRVALYGDTALVGAILSDDNGSESGSAYVFVRNGTNWTRQAKLLPSDGAAGDFFGVGTSVSGDVAWVGANRDDDNGENSGAAYVFRLRCGDGILDPVEECDDGNNDNGDGCAADCTIEESDVPATSGLGMILLVLVISGCTAYFLRRSTTT